MVNYKKLVSYLLSFVIALSPVLMINSANAQTVGGWTVNNVAAQGAKAVVSASQNVMINGKEYIKKGTALVAPTASQVSKVLARGGAAYALSFAVEQLLGSVDWVLDPANNQIKYWDKPGKPYFVGVPGSDLYAEGATREEACKMYAPLYDKKYGSFSTSYFFGTTSIYGDPTPTSTWWCYLNKQVYDTLTPSAVRIDGKVNVEELGQTEGEVKTYPLPAIADYLIKKAEEGNTTAQTATVAAAQDIVNDAEKDDVKAAPLVNQFENSATTENADAAEQDAANSATGQTKPNTETGGTDLALEFPAFCGWAPTVCQAAQVVISFPQKLENWYKESTKAISEAYTATKEWLQKDRENTDDQLDIPTPTKPDIDTNINFNSSCPASITLASFSYHGSSQNWQVDFSQLCDSFSTFVKPVVIAMGAFSAVLIVSGVRTNE